jgi:hypothetical protein
MLNPVNQAVSNLVLIADITVRFEFQISPIQVNHIYKLQELFKEDGFFASGTVRIKSSPLSIYAIEYEEVNNWTDLPKHSDLIELKVNEVIAGYINRHGGYSALKASI